MIYDLFQSARTQSKKGFALLVDPDNTDGKSLENLKSHIDESTVDFFFVGGSLVREDRLGLCVRFLKRHFSIPVILFPGDEYQIDPGADAILLLSLISGRNPELLIGKHVIAAPKLRRSSLEILPTGYMLIDGGKSTTASYISQTAPIPSDKPDIAASTALAGELLGLKLIYLDTGSGALHTVPEEMIQKIRKEIKIPIIAGGGIKSGEKAIELCMAGADIVVIGNAVEENPSLVSDISEAVHSLNIINELS